MRTQASPLSTFMTQRTSTKGFVPVPDVPPLPPFDFASWPTSQDPGKEVSVTLDVIAASLVAIAYDLRELRIGFTEMPGRGAGEAGEVGERRHRKGSPQKRARTN